MDNNNQFTFEEDITLDSNVNNNEEPTPEEIRKKLIPIFIGVVILLVIAIVFAFYYFTKDNRDKLICVLKENNIDSKLITYFEDDKAVEIKLIMNVYFNSQSEKKQYLESKKNKDSYCDMYKSRDDISYCKEKNDNKSVTITIGLSGNDKIKEYLEHDSMDELIKKYEKEGLTCAVNKTPKAKEKKPSDYQETNEEKVVKSIKLYVQAVTTAVNDNEFGNLHNSDKIYYIRVDDERKKSCVGIEKGGENPFADWGEAYVAVHYDPEKYSYDYYFTYYDYLGYGLTLTKFDDITSDSIVKNASLDSTNITKQTNGLLTESGEPINLVVISPDTNCLQPNE